MRPGPGCTGEGGNGGAGRSRERGCAGETRLTRRGARAPHRQPPTRLNFGRRRARPGLGGWPCEQTPSRAAPTAAGDAIDRQATLRQA